MKNLSIFGSIITIFGIAFMTTLMVKLLGGLGFVAGPIAFLFAARPAVEGGVWLWEKQPAKED